MVELMTVASVLTLVVSLVYLGLRARSVVNTRLLVLSVVAAEWTEAAQEHRPPRLRLDILTIVDLDRMILIFWRRPESFFPPPYRPCKSLSTRKDGTLAL